MLPRSVQCCFRAAAAVAGTTLCWSAPPALGDPAPNDYPTYARVEYVQECMNRNGGNLAFLYKCSCAIDRLAEHPTYDEFVEASAFVHYDTAPGHHGLERAPRAAPQPQSRRRALDRRAPPRRWCLRGRCSHKCGYALHRAPRPWGEPPCAAVARVPPVHPAEPRRDIEMRRIPRRYRRLRYLV